MNTLDAAIEYATKYGWAVFPVDWQTKKPLTPHGCLDAKKNVGAITSWWKRYPDASIGIATGSISGLVVIDEDIDHDKDINGYQSMREWESIHGELPETVRAITGRGGAHVYYHYSGKDITNRAGILEGVDVRGEGGYVIAPPSRHPNGTEYQWEYPPDETDLAEVDETVLAFLKVGKKDKNKPDFKMPDMIPSGQRNDVLFRFACSLQEQGVSDDAIRVAVSDANDKRCEVPLNNEELDQLVGSALRYRKGEIKALKITEPQREPNIVMRIGKNGEATDQPAQTIANAEEAIAYDSELFGRIQFNELAFSPCAYGNLPWREHKGWREWNNFDDTNLKAYIEHKYGLKNGEKTLDALNNVISKRRFNPIKQMLEASLEEWDGNKHVENLLPNMLGAEKTPYTTAVMRLFMLGAVKRIYEPGCKFDYMIVLVGDQGKGKSTFLRMLAINDEWFNDNFNSLDGDRAFEKLRGMWIVEMAELQATKRAKDVETIKSFITSRADIYRAPYNRRTENRKRMCVLAGTTNPVNFLTDKTGNRRFLPIRCNVHPAPFDMLADEVETKAEICQAWGEIMDEFTRAGGRIPLVLPKGLEKEAENARDEFSEEDFRIGVIRKWLDEHSDEKVSAIMIWRECLGHTFEDLDHKTANQIHEIMKNNVADWKFIGKQRTEKYGVQRCYEKEETFVDADFVEIPFK